MVVQDSDVPWLLAHALKGTIGVGRDKEEYKTDSINEEKPAVLTGFEHRSTPVRDKQFSSRNCERQRRSSVFLEAFPSPTSGLPPKMSINDNTFKNGFSNINDLMQQQEDNINSPNSQRTFNGSLSTAVSDLLGNQSRKEILLPAPLSSAVHETGTISTASSTLGFESPVYSSTTEFLESNNSSTNLNSAVTCSVRRSARSTAMKRPADCKISKDEELLRSVKKRRSSPLESGTPSPIINPVTEDEFKNSLEARFEPTETLATSPASSVSSRSTFKLSGSFGILKNTFLKPLFVFGSSQDSLSDEKKSIIKIDNSVSFPSPILKRSNGPTSNRLKSSLDKTPHTSSATSLLAKFPNFLGSSEPLLKPISPSGPPDFTSLPDLVCEDIGGKIVFATDDFFGASTNLLRSVNPTQTKMEMTQIVRKTDGWETRRRRCPGHDWCLIELGIPGVVHGIEISTTFFSGNHAPYFSVEAGHIDNLHQQINTALREQKLSPYIPGEEGTGQSCDAADVVNNLLKKHTLEDPKQWRDLVEMAPLLTGDDKLTQYFFVIKGSPTIVTHLRLNLFPDGGLARFRVYGVGLKTFDKTKEINLSYNKNGALVLGCSDEQFGLARELLFNKIMHKAASGWETARNPGRHPCLECDTDTGCVKNLIGENWVIIKLGGKAEITTLEIDTTNYIGNYPERVCVKVADLSNSVDLLDVYEQRNLCIFSKPHPVEWLTLLPSTRLGPNLNHVFKLSLPEKRRGRYKGSGSVTPPPVHSKRGTRKEDGIDDVQSNKLIITGPATHLKMIIYPDGGIARIRAFGKVCP